MSDAAAATCLPRPQPLGVFPLPAGYLLIGEGSTHDEIRHQLTSGKLPEEFPESLRFYQLALDGHLEKATEAIVGTDAISAANRLVLDPSNDHFELALEAASVSGDKALQAFVDTMGFIIGLVARPADATNTDGEFAALVYATQATLAMEQDDVVAASKLLEEAAKSAEPVSRALAGQLLGQLANAQVEEGEAKQATATIQVALEMLGETDLGLNRAELHVAAGAMFQERSESHPRYMEEAIIHYHQAMELVTIDSGPEIFATANANMGLAYLTMSMEETSDELRIGTAVEKMRKALQVFRPDAHPTRWSSTQLNLANALVYLPSKHQAKNIVEAVDLYQQVLEHREGDAIGRARVLANQGNALTRLGEPDQAIDRLTEAKAVFVQHADTEAAAAVQVVLDSVA